MLWANDLPFGIEIHQGGDNPHVPFKFRYSFLNGRNEGPKFADFFFWTEEVERLCKAHLNKLISKKKKGMAIERTIKENAKMINRVLLMNTEQYDKRHFKVEIYELQ